MAKKNKKTLLDALNQLSKWSADSTLTNGNQLGQSLINGPTTGADLSPVTVKKMPCLTHSVLPVPELSSQFTDEDLVDEPQLFKANFQFAFQQGGLVVRTCLNMLDQICKSLSTNLKSSDYFLHNITHADKQSQVVVSINKKNVKAGGYFKSPSPTWENNTNYYFQRNLFHPFVGSSMISFYFGRTCDVKCTTIKPKALFNLLCRSEGLDPTISKQQDVQDMCSTISIPGFLDFVDKQIFAASETVVTPVSNGSVVHYFPATLFTGIEAKEDGPALEVQMSFGTKIQAHNLIL